MTKIYQVTITTIETTEDKAQRCLLSDVQIHSLIKDYLLEHDLDKKTGVFVNQLTEDAESL